MATTHSNISVRRSASARVRSFIFVSNSYQYMLVE